jgi:hypothetical protein
MPPLSLGARRTRITALATPTSSECIAVASGGNAFRLHPTPY